jgi:hypothetical protein
MSMFENDQYRWRETYFVLIESSKRPSLRQVHDTIARLDARFTVTNLAEDEDGRFESLTVLAPDDFAALDICYVEGEEVVEHRRELMQDLMTASCRGLDQARWDKINRCDARLDVLHFEQLVDAEDEEPGDMLDPSALLVVLNGLAKLTDGEALDPQTGTML